MVQSIGRRAADPEADRLPAPALTMFSQALLGTLFGIMGGILETQVISAVLVLVRMTYVEDVLEGKMADRSGAAGPPRE